MSKWIYGFTVTTQPTNQQNLNVQTTTPDGSTVLVGTSSIQVAAADLKRRGIIFANPGTVTIRIVPGNEVAVAGQGIPLLPGAMLQLMGGKLINYNSAWNAIADSGSANPLTILDLTASKVTPSAPVVSDTRTINTGDTRTINTGDTRTIST